MKKLLSILVLVIIFTIGFSITTITEINYNVDVSFAEEEILRIFKNYDVIVGEMTSEIDVRLALRQVNELGFFSNINYELDKEKGVLDLFFKLNPIIKNYEIKITGVELLDKKDTKKQLENIIVLNEPFNVKKYQNAMQKIQQFYSLNGYQFIAIESNIKIVGDELILEPTQIGRRKHDENTLVFIITEFSLWDIELQGEFAELDKDIVKDRINFNFRKDREEKFFLFRATKKSTYPSLSSIQQIFSDLRELPYFGENTSVDFKPVDIENVEGAHLVLVLSGDMPKIIEQETFINRIEFKGNNSLETFRLLDVVNEVIELDNYITNSQILYSLDLINQRYKKDGYIFIETTTEVNDNTLLFDIKEYRVGKVNITSEATLKTRNYIIESLNTLETNKVINQKDLRDLYSSFMGTGFFEEDRGVDIFPSNMYEDKIDFTLKLKERDKPGKFLGGITWSMPREDDEGERDPWYYGFSGQLEVSWPNPFGYGQTFGINTEIIPLQRHFTLGFDYNIIRLLQSNLDLGFKTTYTFSQKGRQDYDLGEKISNQLSLSLRPRYKISNLSYITSSISYDSYTIFTEEETIEATTLQRLSASAGFLYSSIDNPQRPKSGELFSIRGISGLNIQESDQYYVGAVTEAKYFHSFYKFVSGTRLKLGYTYDEHDLYRYTLGRYTGVRGYIGDEMLRGNNLFLFNQELNYEIASGAVPIDLYIFFDWGNSRDDLSLFEDPIWSYGPGIKLTIPMLGQIRFDYVINNESENLFDGKFEFGFGNVF